MLIEATFNLPDGHKSVGAFADKDEAVLAARKLVATSPSQAFYLMDKRGAWEIIAYPRALPPTAHTAQ